MRAKVLSHANMDKVFDKVKDKAVIVNNLSLETEEDRAYVKSLTLNTYETTDVVASVPSCRCGATTDNHRLGKICGHCGFEVEKPNTSKIEPMLWIAAPKPIGLLPTNLLWIFCQKELSARSFDGLAWICDPFAPTPDARSPQKAQQIVKRFNALGINRGLKTFIEQFDLILHKVIGPTITDLLRRKDLYDFCSKFRDQLFAQATPIPHKMAMVVEQTKVGKFYDKTIDAAIEAVYTAAETAGEENVPRLESRFTKVLCSLATFCRDAVENILLHKKGFLRRVCYGLRVKFAFRNVITSEHGPHDYRGVGVPYHQLLSVFEPFVRRRLIDQGMTLREAVEYIQVHQKDCDPRLWAILEDFIDETPPDLYPNPAAVNLPCTLKTKSKRKGRGIGTLGTRFPSLDRGSTQQLFIQYITRDTIEISTIILRAFNADKAYISMQVPYYGNIDKATM